MSKNKTLLIIAGTWRADFNYNNTPPTYSGTWTVTYCFPPGITGGGGSAGDRLYYSP